LWDSRGIELWVKRDDLAHTIVSGNKIRKLAYLIRRLQEGACNGVVSFGGPYSNHLHALAWVCRQYNVPFIAFVRSHSPEVDKRNSATIGDMVDWGTEIRFLSPHDYRQKRDLHLNSRWQRDFPGWTIVPEGGSSPEALPGIAEMVTEVYDKIANPHLWICPVGTGATLAGMIRAVRQDQHVLGISAIKSSVLDIDLRHRWKLEECSNWTLAQQWHFGGYGRTTKPLLSFINDFARRYSIRLDPLYNGKAMFSFCQYVEYGLIPPGSRVVFVHTGGLQGWRGIPNPNLSE